MTVAPPNTSTTFARPGTGPMTRGCSTAGAWIVVDRDRAPVMVTLLPMVTRSVYTPDNTPMVSPGLAALTAYWMVGRG